MSRLVSTSKSLILGSFPLRPSAFRCPTSRPGCQCKLLLMSENPLFIKGWFSCYSTQHHPFADQSNWLQLHCRLMFSECAYIHFLCHIQTRASCMKPYITKVTTDSLLVTLIAFLHIPQGYLVLRGPGFVQISPHSNNIVSAKDMGILTLCLMRNSLSAPNPIWHCQPLSRA